MSDNNTEKEVLEKLLLETLKEQRSRRRWGIFFKLVSILLVLFIIYLLTGLSLSDSEKQPAKIRHTAVIEIKGTISATSAASAKNIIESLNDAFKEPLADGIILKINSPGGSPVQAGLIYDEIMRLRKEHPKKPVYAVSEELCASGSYYIAAAAEKIYVDKASMVGSIGVLINGFGLNKLMDKIGIERRLITAGENKGFLDPFSPQSPEQHQYAKDLVAKVHKQFIDAVKNGRGDRLKDDERIFSGLIFIGEDAIELGLADELGSVDNVARTVIKSPELVDYTKQEKLADRIMKKFGTSVGYGAAKAVLEWDGLQSPAAGNLSGTLRQQ